jgi:hypothetical protein
VIDRANALDKEALLLTVVPQEVNFLSLVGRIKPGEALVSTAAQLATALLGLKLIQIQGSGQAPHEPGNLLPSAAKPRPNCGTVSFGLRTREHQKSEHLVPQHEIRS